MLLQAFIENNKDWEQKLSDMDIKVKRKGDLVIFNYGIKADFNDPLVRECRGVILDTGNHVVCRAFDKFGNYFESYASDIDWDSARVTQKIDGSIVKLYHYDSEWHWATNGVIDASDAPLQGTVDNPYRNFQELIESADNYQDVVSDLDKYDKDETYIFELVSPFNTIVIKYPTTHLYHIGTRNRLSGEESDIDLGIDKPDLYDLCDMDECLEAVKHINGDEIENEGFVVVDSHYNRIKIKADEYFELHRTMTSKLTKKTAVELIQKHGYEYAVDKFPQYSVELAWYLYQYQLFARNVERMEVFAYNLYEESEHDRRFVAEKIKNDPYSAFGFASLDGKKTEVSELDTQKILRFIEDLPKGGSKW